jgi:hypothetical protein
VTPNEPPSARFTALSWSSVAENPKPELRVSDAKATEP